MANPFAKWKRNLNLVWLYAVEARATSDRREGPYGIAPNIPARQLRQQTYGERRPLELFLQPSCEQVGAARLDVVAVLRSEGLYQTLGVLLLPPKATANEESLVTDRNLLTGHHVAGEATYISLVPEHSQPLPQSEPTERKEENRCDVTELR